MKKALILLGIVTVLFAFGDRNQSSFSQRVNSTARTVQHIPTIWEIKKEQYKKDTISLNRQIETRTDCLRAENSKTTTIVKDDVEKTLKTQKANQNDLIQIRKYLKKGLADSNKVEAPMDTTVLIQKDTVFIVVPASAADTIPLDKGTRKHFFDHFKFWKYF